MNGALVVDKPSGPTSHDVVNRVRRVLGTTRIGHTGTLDPLATGVLVLVVGNATRLAQFLSSDDKEYLADIRFGIATATYDSLSPELAAAPPDATSPVDLSGLDASLGEFRGTYRQTPPPFSAKKIAGTRAYELARAGKTPALTPVEVTVSALEVVGLGADTARLRIVSSSGFYVRTLAHEIGRRLGCGGHLTALRRTRAGSFRIADAVMLDAIEARGSEAATWLMPIDRLLAEFPHVVLNEGGVRRALHGSRLSVVDFASGEPFAPPSDGRFGGRVRLIGPAGALVAIAEAEPGGALHPFVVLV